jgi:Uma2 family endonuclease
LSTVRKAITPQEYLAIERQAKTKSEYLHGEMFAMSGASVRHNYITINLAGEIRQELKSRPCDILPADMRVKIDATGLYTYPDLSIVCGKLQLEDASFDTLLNPAILIEVLSESTEKYDRGAKFKHYRQIASLREYVLVSQEEPLVERYTLQPDGTWVLQVFDAITGNFAFGSIDVQISMAEIYRGVEFGE